MKTYRWKTIKELLKDFFVLAEYTQTGMHRWESYFHPSSLFIYPGDYGRFLTEEEIQDSRLLNSPMVVEDSELALSPSKKQFWLPASEEPKCECGAESARTGGHSTWCPKFAES